MSNEMLVKSTIMILDSFMAYSSKRLCEYRRRSSEMQLSVGTERFVHSVPARMCWS